MPKALPCPICKDSARLPDGKDYLLSSHPLPGRPWSYRCFRCKHKFSIGAIEFNRLPDVDANA